MTDRPHWNPNRVRRLKARIEAVEAKPGWESRPRLAARHARLMEKLRKLLGK